jgi:5-methyltetrahydropteroyltriglutamate--homocysteine methyltransferase
MAWSFVRDDQPRTDTARQVALALHDEARDLAAGIRIHVHEPALRELLPPLREAGQPAYLDRAVAAFWLATPVSPTRRRCTLTCAYSDFGDVIDAVDGLDADVTSLEAARSRMEVLPKLAAAGFVRGIGPGGVYDVHSPRAPPTDEIAALLGRPSWCLGRGCGSTRTAG